MAARNEVPANDSIRSPHMSLPVSELKDDKSSTTSGNITIQPSSTLNLKERDKPQPHSPFVDDPRTLQLALELSMVGLNSDSLNSSVIQTQAFASRSKSLGHNSFISSHQEIQSTTLQNRSFHNQQFDSNALSLISAAVAAAAATQTTTGNSIGDFTSPMACPSAIEERSKKSQNMTECVPVPSSEHVAEIVGRQGCKIKALRAKTNTYIKTPVRNEEPVFVVTGRKEDVAKAKREIVSAAEHFSFIRATRKHSLICGSNNSILSPGDNNINRSNDCIVEHGRISHGPSAGQITIQVRVPYRVVGLVVGPKGATIKHIQQETQTYIVTPSREKEPIFEVTGSPENVESARKHIEAHIALRTGTLTAIENSCNDCELNAEVASANFSPSDNLNTLNNILNEDSNRDIIDSLYRNHLYSDLHHYGEGTNDGIFYDNKSENNTGNPQRMSLLTSKISPLANSISYTKIADCGKLSSSESNNIVVSEEISHKKDFSISKLIQKKQQRNMINDLNVASNTVNTNTTVTTNVATRSCSSASSTTSSKSANNSCVSTNTNCSRPELLSFWKNLANSLDVDEDPSEQQSCLWNTSNHSLSFNTKEKPNKKTIRHSITISPTDSILDETSPSTMSSFNANAGLRDVLPPTTKVKSQHPSVEKASIYLAKCALCNKDGGTVNQRSCSHKIFCKDCVGIGSSGQHVCPVCNNSAFRENLQDFFSEKY